MTPAPVAPNTTDSGLPAGLETAYEPVSGSVRMSKEGRRVVVRYVAIDPWPPNRFFPDNGLRGRLDNEPSEFAIPLTRDGERFRKAADGENVERWWMPPRHLDCDQASEMLDTIMESYAAWKAGELCGYVTETFTKSGRSWQHYETSVEWAHLSARQAQLRLDAMDQPEPEIHHAPAP